MVELANVFHWFADLLPAKKATVALMRTVSLPVPRAISWQIDPYLILLLALNVFALAPLAAPGYFYSAHDGRHSVFFVTMFDESIRSGALWPRWAMHHNQGYGYPTFLVQAPLAFYLAEFFVRLGFGITNAVKMAWAVGFVGGTWGMYALVKAWILGMPTTAGGRASSTRYASLCGVVAGLLYTYAPYHLLDIYVRAAFAETMMMAWFPWVVLAFDRLIVRGTAKGWQGRLLVAALCYAALLLTHVFALVAFTPLLAAFILFRLWMVWQDASPMRTVTQNELVPRAVLAAAAGIAALLLAAVFLLPLFVEGSVLVQEEWTQNTYDYTRHWIYWGQFFDPFWGYGYSDDPTGAQDGMGFQAGIMLIVLALIAAYFLLTRHMQGTMRMMLFLLVASLAVLAIMTPAAATIWRSVPLIDVIQFPWRLLALAAFCLSALGGLVLSQFHGVGEQLSHLPRAGGFEEGGLLVIALVVCFAGFGYSQPAALEPIEAWREDGRAVMQFEQEHPDMMGTTRYVEESFTESAMTEQYLQTDFSHDAIQRLAVIAGEGEVLEQYSLGHAFGGEVMMQEAGTVQIRLFEFPGWQIRLDGEFVEHRLSPPYGLMEVDVPAGHHQIDLWMGSTGPRTVGAITSALTLLLLIGLWLYPRRSGAGWNI